MKETGIIMSGDHPTSIQKNLKTMTRRTYGLEKINKNPDEYWLYDYIKDIAVFDQPSGEIVTVKCPYGQVGDLLYVKETYAIRSDGRQVLHKAGYEQIVEALDLDNFAEQQGLPPLNIKWKSPRFMKKEYARIWLEIVGLRAERLQDITSLDAVNEGCPKYHEYNDKWECIKTIPPVERFHILWDSLNAKRGYTWESNPWVWPISFKEIVKEA